MATVPGLIATQITDFGLMSRAVTNLNKLGKAKITTSIVRSRLQQLKAYWDHFRATHSVLQSTASDELKQTDNYFVSDLFSSANDAFEQASDYMNALLDELTNPISPHALEESFSNIVDRETHPQIQLPRMNLPQFSGNYADWQHFYDLFNSLVIENYKLSKVQKLHYLKSTLTGEASLLLKNVVVTESNFQSSWDLLKKRYDNKRSLVHALLHNLLNIPTITSPTVTNLKLVRDQSSDVRSALLNLKRSVQAWDDLFNFIIISK